eukprot:CAMPEP_0201525712 /NCGR_PEP_ID=MMETSP0161_2-20130828/29242_1 /ASSEMBLY_ACC=CAM_ASM_000251 /TAXON_ID=180227 /ORGANISM="Neoparamoeba aestuarina, Strain SoJaBio B1-5/56/2" /LENGTH=170 /DNA_ID=CAMNT_0047925777 /DNA_START=54 /DNA_END=563 /DNA_ORIENTATION=-
MTADFMEFLPSGKEQLCQWQGLTCTGEVLTRVQYGDCRSGNFRFEFLPPTVDDIEVKDCGQNFQINIRAFPRDLRIISLFRNFIWGHLDLTVLPEKLQTAYFAYNRLSGPISLVSLPRTLEELYLDDNCISQDVVYYDKLPAGLRLVHLKNYGGTNKIRAVKPVDSSKSA